MEFTLKFEHYNSGIVLYTGWEIVSCPNSILWGWIKLRNIPLNYSESDTPSYSGHKWLCISHVAVPTNLQPKLA